MRASLIALLIVASAGLAVMLGLWRAAGARARSAAAHERLLLTHNQVAELTDLRARSARLSLAHRPKEDLLARLSESLAAIGLPSGRVTDISEEADRELPASAGPRYRRQTMRVTLAPMELADLGRFLDHWRRTQSLWTPVRIELTRSGGNRRQAEGYAARLVVAATYVGDGG